MTTAATGPTLEHGIGPDGLFTVRLRDGEVRLRAVDGGTVRIHDADGHDLSELFGIELGEGSVSVRAARDTGLLRRGWDGGAPMIEVDLPRRATIVVETASAEVEADGLAGDQRYRTTSGDITLRAVSGRIDVEAVSGDLDIVASGECAVAVRTVSGDVELRAGTIPSLRASTTSGDVKIAGRLAGPGPFTVETVSGDVLLAPAGDLRIEMTTMSGDLRSEVDGRSESGRGRRSLSIGSGGPLFTMRSMSGDLAVVKPTPVLTHPSGDQDATTRVPIPPASTPVAAAPLTNGAIALAYEEARLRILRSLERGEVDVAEAGRRLEALDDGDPGDPPAPPAGEVPGA